MNDNANALRSKNAKRAMQKTMQKRTLSAPKIEQQHIKARKRRKRGKCRSVQKRKEAST